MILRHLTLLAAVACCGCSVVPSTPARRIAVRVLDGDTLIVNGEGVRLANVDAPELPPQARCWGEGALGVQAAAKAQDLVSQADSVDLAREGKDRFGRTLGRLTLNGRRDLGEALVFAGVAARHGEKPFDWCGPADFRIAGGPGFETGPQANSRFMAWVSENQFQPIPADFAAAMLRAEDPDAFASF